MSFAVMAIKATYMCPDFSYTVWDTDGIMPEHGCCFVCDVLLGNVLVRRDVCGGMYQKNFCKKYPVKCQNISDISPVELVCMLFVVLLC